LFSRQRIFFVFVLSSFLFLVETGGCTCGVEVLVRHSRGDALLTASSFLILC
jgi:hypothetical protein